MRSGPRATRRGRSSMPLLRALAVAAGLTLGGVGAALAAPDNAAASAAFLAANARRPGVVTLPSGLQYEVLKSGPADGTSPSKSDHVAVRYEARLMDGTVVDASDPNQPAAFVVGRLIPAWTEALQKMRPGDAWMLYAPPKLAYGRDGAGPIPPNSALVFKVELVSVLPAGGG
jgi:FKBP-type peptidyl-prolyl cis-trans isomerase